MKKFLFIILSIILLSNCTSNEENAIPSGYDDLYDLHSRDKGVITIGMPVFIFKLFIDKSNKQVKDVLEQIETIDLFIKEEAEDAFTDEVMRHFPSRTYKNLYGSNTDEAEIKFLVKEKKERVDELIMVANEKENKNLVVLRIGGDFNFKDIERLAEKIDVNDLVKYR